MAGRHVQGGNGRSGSGVSIFFWRQILVLEDCIYVPNVRRNLILISCHSCNGFSIIFNKILFLLNMILMRAIVEC